MRSAEIVDLAERRAIRDQLQAQRAEVILWSPPLFWWGCALALWSVVWRGGRHGS